MMLTSDLALKVDPIYRPIAERFHENPDQLTEAFAKAWYKLLHRDMGPLLALPRPVGAGAAALAGPGPGGRPRARRRRGRRRAQVRGPVDSGLSVPQLVRTAWASAASFRGTDKRGGANGARIRLAPQKDWEANEPASSPRCWRRWSRSGRASTTRRRAGRGSRSPT